FTLAGGEAKAEAFYDKVRISKGPSLGTYYSLLCPYTLLAHYDELEWAQERGVDPHLLRISIGEESLEDLQARFSEAW
ncbi:MAG: PLP-dependent transferase, partial [Verrucomicrobiota bacterium]